MRKPRFVKEGVEGIPIRQLGDPARIQQRREHIARSRVYGFYRQTEIWVGLHCAARDCTRNGLLVSQEQLREWADELSRVCALLPYHYKQCPSTTEINWPRQHLRCQKLEGHTELHSCFKNDATHCWRNPT